MTMKTVIPSPSLTRVRKYRVEFYLAATVLLIATFAVRIHRMARIHSFYDIPTNIVGYLICVVPFLLLVLRIVRWGVKNSELTRQQFACRIFGVFAVYTFYLGWALYTINAEYGPIRVDMVFYLISIFFVGSMYRISYIGASKIYSLLFPKDDIKADVED